MKDSIILLITAVFMAAVAWAFWSFLGANAFDVLCLLALVTLGFDNIRLRKALRNRTSAP